MKRILPEYEFSEEQLNTIGELAKECDLCFGTVKILYGRGIRDRESILNFLHPSKERFIPPFKMGGMREAVNLITRARDGGWNVAVYGDYDADGICAATILGGALKDYGITPALCVPERRNGYGLSKELIDGLFEAYSPRLVITVDCGISCAEEVEYIKEKGAEVIVTDHHELPATLPGCICINPKFNDGYPYDNLCGAGVAFKVACALLGEAAYKYLDFAAIATVADSVPLTGENRDIVYEGLKLINSNPRSCYSRFYKDATVTSQTLAFSVAPKINAAGRMGDANAALELFNQTDEKETELLAARLADYNSERQKYCDELYLSAKKMLAGQAVNDKIIILSGEDWNPGFVGIVAARLADEYSRPVILFVRNGDMYRGSARSVESVNIFEALKSAGQYIAEFGGHSQAAGVNVTADNYDAMKSALNEYMLANFSGEDFSPAVYVGGELKGEFSPRFARELEMLEPFGVGNKRPMFVLEEGAMPVRPVKAQSTHISMKHGNFEMVYFGGLRFAGLLESRAPKKLIFEYNISTFRGKEYVKGFVRDVIYDNSAGKYASAEINLNNLSAFAREGLPCEIERLSRGEINRELSSCPEFGTVFIAEDYSDLSQFNIPAGLGVDLFFPVFKNNLSVILLSPHPDADLSGYGRVVYLYDPYKICNPTVAASCVKACSRKRKPSFLNEISTERTELLKIFSALCANAGNLRGGCAEEVAAQNNLGFPPVQVAFALYVFGELGLLSFENGALTVFRGIKTDLSLSGLYNSVCGLKAEVNDDGTR